MPRQAQSAPLPLSCASWPFAASATRASTETQTHKSLYNRPGSVVQPGPWQGKRWPRKGRVRDVGSAWVRFDAGSGLEVGGWRVLLPTLINFYLLAFRNLFYIFSSGRGNSCERTFCLLAFSSDRLSVAPSGCPSICWLAQRSVNAWRRRAVGGASCCSFSGRYTLRKFWNGISSKEALDGFGFGYGYLCWSPTRGLIKLCPLCCEDDAFAKQSRLCRRWAH